MILLGAAVTLDSMTYTLGTLTHMGPGMFPLMLGVTLTFVGVLILGTAMATPLSDDENILPKDREWYGVGLHPRRTDRCSSSSANFSAWSPATFACVFVPAIGDRTATLERFSHPRRRRHGRRHAAVHLRAEDSFPHVPVGSLMFATALQDLWYGFGVALEPHNVMWCFIGVFVGNMVGVLPGMGPLATISILLPLTFGIKPVGAILMLAGVFYGAQYGGAICSILLNLPCHPPHAVTCLDGFPLTKKGRGGAALGITVISSFVGASWGITEMIFLSPILVVVALKFGPAEICSLMLLGLLAGSTLARGSPLKGVAMTVLRPADRHRRQRHRNRHAAIHLRHSQSVRRRGNRRAGARPVRHRRVHEERQSALRGRHQIYQRQAQGSAADPRGVPPLDPGHVPRHADRQPVRADSRHRPDHRLVHLLRHRKEDFEDAGEVRHRHDRRRRLPGSLDPLLGAGRLHPDHEPRHSGRRGDGAASSAR